MGYHGLPSTKVGARMAAYVSAAIRAIIIPYYSLLFLLFFGIFVTFI